MRFAKKGWPPVLPCLTQGILMLTNGGAVGEAMAAVVGVCVWGWGVCVCGRGVCGNGQLPTPTGHFCAPRRWKKNSHVSKSSTHLPAGEEGGRWVMRVSTWVYLDHHLG